MTPEEEVYFALKENLEAGERALANKDWAAVRALAEQEARLMDSLRAIWQQRRDDDARSG